MFGPAAVDDGKCGDPDLRHVEETTVVADDQCRPVGGEVFEARALLARSIGCRHGRPPLLARCTRDPVAGFLDRAHAQDGGPAPDLVRGFGIRALEIQSPLW